MKIKLKIPTISTGWMFLIGWIAGAILISYLGFVLKSTN